MRVPAHLLAAIVALTSACAPPEEPGPSGQRGQPGRPEPPGDIVLIGVDTLRFDHVSANDPASPATTPAIDSLARDGVRFERAWSPISVTGPAFASLLTGRTIAEHGVATNLFRGGAPLADEQLTLAEVLSDVGYRTGAFVSGFTLRREVGLDQGFAVYESPESVERWWGEHTLGLTLRWLDRNPTPVFLWFHSFDPHGPLDRWPGPEAPAAGWTVREDSPISPHQQIDGIADPSFYRFKYARAVEGADANLGTLLAYLKRTGRYDSALIALVADHGEGLDEREIWFEHGSNAYAEQLHVPLIVKLPHNREAGSTRRVDVSTVGLARTLLEESGITPPDSFGNRNLLRTAGSIQLGESSHCKPSLAIDCFPGGAAGKIFVVRDADTTLLRKSLRSGSRLEIYDRRNDPRELSATRVLEGPADGVAQVDGSVLENVLRGVVRERLAEQGDQPPAAETDEATLELLRSLGYVN